MDGQGTALVGNRVGNQILASTPLAVAPAIEQALIAGDLKGLKPEERVTFYNAVCKSVGLNPLTRPFDYIVLNGKLTLYARKDATDQLRKLHDVNVNILSREFQGDAYVVKAEAWTPNGRHDESLGIVNLKGKSGEEYANGMMKAETKAKRRVTLSICGLGFLDESEVDRPQRAAFRYESTEEPPAQLPATTESAQCEQTGSGSAPTQFQSGGLDEANLGKGSASKTEPGKKAGITKEQGKELAAAFAEALPRGSDSLLLLNDWLGKQFFLDAGNPSLAAIPAAEFDKWKAEAVKWAAQRRTA